MNRQLPTPSRGQMVGVGAVLVAIVVGLLVLPRLFIGGGEDEVASPPPTPTPRTSSRHPADTMPGWRLIRSSETPLCDPIDFAFLMVIERGDSVAVRFRNESGQDTLIEFPDSGNFRLPPRLPGLVCILTKIPEREVPVNIYRRRRP